MDEIAEALTATASELGWPPTLIAAKTGKTEQSARYWLSGEKAIGGPDLLLLLRTMPGLHERLLPQSAVRGAA